jgi:lipid-A-disaccharide synthase
MAMVDRKSKTVVMVAGEASGDLHGAQIIKSLHRHRRHGPVTISGSGGPAMKRAGAQVVVDIKELSVMGITAVLAKAPRLIKMMARLKRHIAHTRPDLLLLIDFPDFNLHLAGYAKKLGIPVLYYISPTVWAWRSGRVHKIKKRVDHMAVILPFEAPIYEKHNVPVTYVGHPLLDDADVARYSNVRRTAWGLAHPRIALLPGSREDEVKRLLPNMLRAAQMIQKQLEHVRFVISHAPSIERDMIQDLVNTYPINQREIIRDPVGAVFHKSEIAIVASGTASLEAAIHGIPAVIVYEVSALSYWLGKKLVDVPHIGLANLIAGERIMPELVQEDATAENMAAITLGLLTDATTYERMLADIEKIQKRLGYPGASDRVASIAYRLMEGRRAV